MRAKSNIKGWLILITQAHYELIFTSDSSSTGRLLARMTSVLFCWHTRHRSGIETLDASCHNNLWSKLLPEFAEEGVANCFLVCTYGCCLIIQVPHLAFCCRRWKKLQVISFVARYPAWKKNGMVFGILKDKHDYILDV